MSDIISDDGIRVVNVDLAAGFSFQKDNGKSQIDEPITTNDKDWAEKDCPTGSVSVWVPKQ